MSISPMNASDPTTYAPVAIPTLCRQEHLMRCVESLSQCSGADKTHVYIALDYPLKDSHRPGWIKCKEYLASLEHNHKFDQLTVIYRDRNYGLGIDGNHWDLVRKVLETHDRFIFTEDDNIFSPAFLMFINKGLEIFKDDESIISINGYRHFYNIPSSRNNYYKQNVDFSAWGFGMWKDRFESVQSHISSTYLRRKAFNPLTWIKVKRNGNNRFLQFLRGLLFGMPLEDNSISVDMAINSKDVIMPYVSMVRNTGWDDSGEHCSTADSELVHKHLTQPLYNSSDFEYFSVGEDNYTTIHSTYVKESYGALTIGQLIGRTLKSLKRKLIK